jgi:hypothetical protein
MTRWFQTLMSSVTNAARPGRIVGVSMSILVLALPDQAGAYLKFGAQIDDRTITLKWAQMPVRYFVSTSNQNVPGVGVDAFQAAVGRAFATWQGLPTASISYQFAGFTAALPNEDDGMSTLGFLRRPELDRVLAETDFLFDRTTGAMIESVAWAIRRLAKPSCARPADGVSSHPTP